MIVYEVTIYHRGEKSTETIRKVDKAMDTLFNEDRECVILINKNRDFELWKVEKE